MSAPQPTSASLVALHSYRAVTVPAHVEAADVEEYAAKGVLNSIQFKAPNADLAARTARHLTGQHVFSVERIEREQVAA